MEELLKHCLQQLSFDGDFGTSITRWPAVVASFYNTPERTGTQNIDADYVSYLWSLFILSPSVRVGLRPPANISDFWFAPKQAKGRKAATEDEGKPSLQPLDDGLLQSLTYEQLVEGYGARLHVAATEEFIFETLTGSHVQPAKLSDMAYTTLQMIARQRDKGLPIDNITKATGYSSGTVFYLVKTLCELGLILKLRTGGTSMNIAILRYFWERSPAWQAIHSEEPTSTHEEMAVNEPEEPEAESDADEEPAEQATTHVDMEEEPIVNHDSEASPNGGGSNIEAEDDAVSLPASASNPSNPPLPPQHFSPIDARSLSSGPLIRARILTLLRASRNGMHIYKNLIFAIGCMNPSRQDRRFFIVRIREGIRDGLWEKVCVPGIKLESKEERKNRKEPSTEKKVADVMCLRLLSETVKQTEESKRQAEKVGAEDDEDVDVQQNVVENLPLWNVSLHKQITNILHEAGHLGVTISDVSEKLGHLDRRTIEHLLDTFATTLPPPHLLDSGVASVLQNYGRERRHEYWTIPAFRATIASGGGTTVGGAAPGDEGLLPEHLKTLIKLDMSDVGGFAKFAQDEFYYPSGPPPVVVATDATPSASDHPTSTSAKPASSAALAAASNNDVDDVETAESRVLAYVLDHYISHFSAVGSGRRKKSGGLINDGQPKKRGRPKKEYAPGEEPSPKKKRKAKKGDVADGEGVAEVPKKTPRKKAKKEEDAETAGDAAHTGDAEPVVEVTPKPKKKLGRPRKQPLEQPDTDKSVTVNGEANIADATAAGPSTPKIKPKRTPRAKATPKSKSGAAGLDPDAESTDSPRAGVSFAEAAPTFIEPSTMPPPSSSGTKVTAASSSANKSSTAIPGASSTTTAPVATPKKKRGRPSLKDLVARAEAQAEAASAAVDPQIQTDAVQVHDTTVADLSMAGEDMSVAPKEPDVADAGLASPPKKKRGRPRKTDPSGVDTVEGQPATKRRRISKSKASLASDSSAPAPAVVDVSSSASAAAPASEVEADEPMDVDKPVSPSLPPVPPETTSEVADSVASTSRSALQTSPANASTPVRPRLSKKASSSPKTSTIRPYARSRAKILAPVPVAVASQTPSTPNRPSLAGPLSKQPSNVILSQQASTNEIDTIALASRAAEQNDASSDPITQISEDITVDPKVTKPVKSRKQNNINAIRRRAEFLQVLEDMGGIANTMTPEFVNNHSALISTLTTGTSAPPGTSMDRRTVRETLETMVELKTIKRTAFPVRSANAAHRQCTVIYLPHIQQAEIDKYIDSIKGGLLVYRPHTVKKLEEPVEFERIVNQESRANQVTRWVNNEQVSSDPEEQRTVVMNDPRAILQAAGYITGRFARAKELHLFLLAQMETSSGPTSPYFLSNRILRTEYLWEDMPIGSFCAQVSWGTIHPPLIEYLASEENRWTPCRLIPPELHHQLSIGKGKSRKMFRDMLTTLQGLGITTPLVESISDTPFATCGDLSFDISTEDNFALYWQFNDTVPLYKSHKSSYPPPYVMTYDISTEEGRLLYWHQLQNTSLFDTPQIAITKDGPPYPGDIELIRAMTKSSSWVSDYVLGPLQRDYLERLIDPTTGEHQFSDEAFMQQQEYITGAPADTIRAFVDRKSQSIILTISRMQEEKAQKERTAKRRREAAELLARKASELRNRLEKEWSELVQAIHPEPFTAEESSCLAKLHDEFCNSGGKLNENFSPDKLATKIRDALPSASVVRALPAGFSERLRRNLKTRRKPTPRPKPQIIEGGESVYDLINAQEPLLDKQTREKRPKGEDDIVRRGKRFKWTRELDELAIDAMAILRARAQDAESVVQLDAFDQIFPGVMKTGVRNRLVKIVKPIESYFRRLQAAWLALWREHRGTKELEQNYPSGDFDLAEHVIFLRNNIDKAAVRGGAAPEKKAQFALPTSMQEILRRFNVVDNHASFEARFNHLYTPSNVISDEIKEKTHLSIAFVRPSVLSHPLPVVENSTPLGKAKSMIKMTMSTDESKFVPDIAERLLEPVDPPMLASALEALRPIYIVKAEGKSGTRPGRAYKYNDAQNSAMYGVLPDTMYRDADELEEDIYANSDWMPWPLLGADGSVGALAAMISDKKLLSKVDPPDIRAAKELVSDNSKKITDEQIECSVSFRVREETDSYSTSSPSTSPFSATISLPVLDESPLDEVHRVDVSGATAPCMLDPHFTSGDVVDCRGCLETAKSAVIASGLLSDRATIVNILDTISSFSSDGCTVEGIASITGNSVAIVHRIVSSLKSSSTPLVFCVGYTPASRIVAAAYIRPWTVEIRQDAADAVSAESVPDMEVVPSTSMVPIIRMVFSRRWRDIHGDMVHTVWRAGLKAVYSTLMLRPGISEAELIVRLADVYDRPEVLEILEVLRDEGFVHRLIDEQFAATGILPDCFIVGATSGEQERAVYWQPMDTATHPWWHV